MVKKQLFLPSRHGGGEIDPQPLPLSTPAGHDESPPTPVSGGGEEVPIGTRSPMQAYAYGSASERKAAYKLLTPLQRTHARALRRHQDIVDGARCG